MEENTNYLEIVEMANYINNIIESGIIIADEKMPFTLLDYYTITNIDRKIFMSLLNTRGINGMNRNSYLRNFLEKTRGVSNIINDVEEILEQHNVFIVNNQRYVPSKDDIEMIFNLFDDNNIPRYNRLIYTALNRLARGQQILPLLNSDEKTKSR